MVTDITAYTSGGVVAEDHSWTIGEHGYDMTDNAPLDLTTFTGDNFADGYARSGCVLGQITASGKWGAYDPAAADGRQTAAGHLFNSVRLGATTELARVVSDAVFVHGFVNTKRLPYPSGPGSLDAAARTALHLIRYV